MSKEILEPIDAVVRGASLPKSRESYIHPDYESLEEMVRIPRRIRHVILGILTGIL